MRTSWLMIFIMLLLSSPAVSGDSDSDRQVAATKGATDSSGSPKGTGRSGGSADSCEMDAYQAELLKLVNAARSEGRMCGSASYAAADPLTYSCVLEQAAQAHSEDMATNDFLSHTGSDGSSVSERVTVEGYAWRAVGENVAEGYASPADVINGWLDSAGHCANIMNPDFTEFGAARIDSSSADGRSFWTQVFAAPR